MAQHAVKFEDLLGKTVRNQYGRAIGRIEDARIEPEGEDYLIKEFLIGPLEWLPRLLAFMGELPTLRALGIGHRSQLRPIPWQWMDLSDPARPVLTEEERKDGRTGRAGRTGKTVRRP